MECLEYYSKDGAKCLDCFSKSTKDTKAVAVDFAKRLGDYKPIFGNGATIVGLYGDLGAGKTTFMKYFAESLGVENTVQSPTFVIEKIYDLPGGIYRHLIHIDAYRLESADEMLKLGWKDIILDPSNIICVEWPEKIAGIINKHIKINFEHVSEEERKITLNYGA